MFILWKWCLQVQGPQALPSLPYGLEQKPEENRYVTQTEPSQNLKKLYKGFKTIFEEERIFKCSTESGHWDDSLQNLVSAVAYFNHRNC